MAKNILLFVLGAVISVLFIVFSTSLFEVLYYEREFSNEMYNANLYLPLAFVDVMVAWVLAAIYYYVINSVRFSRWYHWLIVLVIAMVLAPSINYIYANAAFADDGLAFYSQLLGFTMVGVIIEAVLFIIVSFSLRWWSSNCRHTPIPE